MQIVSTFFSLAILAAALFVGSRPFIVHGGRFVTEYMIVAVPVGLVALLLLWLTWR